MSTFTQFLHKIFSGIESQEQRDEDYLAQSVDASDLERRIHELEYRGTEQQSFPLHAAFPARQGRRALW
ncbi:hypothetical protein GALL_282700 [mine drainage metagenome]|jgi:hypothetical protein|uniref:DUF3563 domain-containing protein n=2 Tax=root TaxID=1 RepID=A0A238CZY1_THIDL|nr:MULTISPECIES: DUF3563 family protein [Thiomonas]MBX9717023.1 DUF3563 domain-containing protein [Burkholderiaceae bacterium]MDE2130965.1 DUF3563 family protein [Betaproteobacteria bacterium]OZB44122.1 MAG: hypothetical protein B7X46_10250 [Thiomonas sp. 15-66-11]OZB62293.1 MAG: hypothetical protein B7X31_09805 [Thiomonas sp. 13-66-29]MBX9793635.1 DUF3563 domain-containing protein [Burkholderiaceae bacterium]